MAAVIANIVVACILSGAFAGEVYSNHGHLYDHFRGPLVAAAATPRVSFVEPFFPPQPYSFGYENVDKNGTRSYHNEKGDANNVKTGSYGYRDANGIYRRVSYVADANGFRATVDTNEPGTVPGYSADATFNALPIRFPAAAKAASAPVPVYAPPPLYTAAQNAYVLHAPWSS